MCIHHSIQLQTFPIFPNEPGTQQIPGPLTGPGLPKSPTLGPCDWQRQGPLASGITQCLFSGDRLLSVRHGLRPNSRPAQLPSLGPV